MGSYEEALGRMEFTVSGRHYVLRPKKGDNLKIAKIQQNAGKDVSKLFEQFIPFVVELINREEQIEKTDSEYANLELFVEMNVMEFFKETMIAFRWTSRDKWEQAETEAIKGFQVGLRQSEI